MVINLDGEKPKDISQEAWERLKQCFGDIYDDEE